MIAAIVLVSIAAYVAGIILTARWRYNALRPYTEPMSCGKWCSRALYGDHYEHREDCYRQWGQIETTSEAIGIALLQSLIWPLLLLWLGFGRRSGRGLRSVITSGAHATIAELEAKNARLERELGITDGREAT